MKIIKVIGIGILILIAIPLIVALFVKKDYAVEKEIVINRPHHAVYNYVVLLKNQNNYSKWATMDPKMKKTFKGTDGTVGFVSRWESSDSDVGTGEQEILKIIPGSRIDYELRFIEPMKSKDFAYMLVDSLAPNQSIVKWGFSGKMTYPSNLTLLFMDISAMIGNDFSEGLSHLKSILETE